MNKIYHTDQNRFIVYNEYKSKQNSIICVIFLHGLLSNMESSKAIFIEEFCKNKNLNFVRFDNFGHGISSGNFTDETIGSWLQGLNLVMNQLELQNIILIGSSMGAWISLIAGLKYHNLIKGIITISAAPDFTYESIWNKLPKLKREQMQKEGVLEIGGKNCDEKYPISYNLIKESEQYLLLSLPSIDINCPVHLIHGMEDTDAPYQHSIQLCDKISSKHIQVKLIKDGKHRLSRPQDLELIADSLEAIIAQIQCT